MAIKSKGRTRGRRAVAAAPRRPLVVRKPPIWRRPWVWIVVAVVAVAGITFGILAVLHSHQVTARKAREKLAMTKLYLQFKSGLPSDLRSVPPDVLVIFPSVTDDLAKIGKDLKGADVTARGKEIIDESQTSVKALQAIRVDTVIPAEFAQDRADVKDGIFLISRSIDLYRQVGGLVQASADLPRTEQKAVVEQATQLTQQAANLFDQGYRKILAILTRLDIPHNVPASVPVTPGGQPSALPTALPSQTASTPPATSSASPTASASP
jgi:hypothetical protein